MDHEKLVAKEFNYWDWRDKIKEPKLRFHSEFTFTPDPSVWKPTESFEYDLSNSFILKFTQKSYRNLQDTTVRICITIAVCESVISAHEHVFTNLTGCTNPYYYKSHPNTDSYGDIVIGTFWARDNIGVNANYESCFDFPDKRITELNKQIDQQLLFIPTETDTKKNVQKKNPVKITLPSDYIPLGEIVPINITVDNFVKNSSKPLIVAEGGRVSLKNGTYFYIGKELGEHTIKVYVTSDSAETYSDKVTFEVVE